MYTVTITHEHAALRRTVAELVDAIDLVSRCMGAHVDYLALIDDVRQIGEHLAFTRGVWVRVTSEVLH